MKSISTINSVIMENTKGSIIKTGTSVINKISRCVAWSLRFTSSYFEHFWVPLQVKNNVRSTSASTALTQASHQSHNAHITNHHLHGKREMSGAQRRSKVSFGRTMMQALELLRLAKRHILGWSDDEHWRNQACSYSHYQVTLVWRH